MTREIVEVDRCGVSLIELDTFDSDLIEALTFSLVFFVAMCAYTAHSIYTVPLVWLILLDHNDLIKADSVFDSRLKNLHLVHGSVLVSAELYRFESSLHNDFSKLFLLLNVANEVLHHLPRMLVTEHK